ncbi:MAG: hypothetical protein M1820_001036 [Bogoriella megaspora]|nr:MAG: hypothetical protein M1820_001036 [Bogoriella megaspora]
MAVYHLALLLSLTSLSLALVASVNSTCRCFPGDACWPSPTEWSSFNTSLGGKLVATLPLAAPCHSEFAGTSTYNNATCQTLQKDWTLPQGHYDSSSSIMAPFFANQSCDPFDGESAQCVVGTYVSYAVNISGPADVAKTIKFAKQRNIRLVIRNTGHDYNGKSTGAGAIAVWTHHLKDISFHDYNSTYYSGKAIKVGAGVQGMEAYAAANASGLAVVSGECPTVGFAGGYTQGGGHSALASKYGLAADQTLEFEVVDGTGKLIHATRDKNSDMYWALSGGGGGTYGVVLSMTSKAHPDIITSGANLTFTNQNITQDTFYKAVSAWHEVLPAIVDAGAMTVWSFTNTSWALMPLTAPGLSKAQVTALLKPFMDSLTALGIQYTSFVGQFSGYLEEFDNMFNTIEVGIAQYGGRFIPRSVVANNNTALTAAYRNITEDGAIFIGVGVNVSEKVSGDVYNAVNPGWRDCLIDTVITTPWNFTAPWSEMVANQVKMTDNYLPQLAALTPGGGAYLNECDFKQPDWQQVLYGSNYDRLLAIKNKHDPDHIFYATTAVGSDYWQVESDGRLCKAQA